MSKKSGRNKYYSYLSKLNELGVDVRDLNSGAKPQLNLDYCKSLIKLGQRLEYLGVCRSKDQFVPNLAKLVSKVHAQAKDRNIQVSGSEVVARVEQVIIKGLNLYLKDKRNQNQSPKINNESDILQQEMNRYLQIAILQGNVPTGVVPRAVYDYMGAPDLSFFFPVRDGQFAPLKELSGIDLIKKKHTTIEFSQEKDDAAIEFARRLKERILQEDKQQNNIEQKIHKEQNWQKQQQLQKNYQEDKQPQQQHQSPRAAISSIKW